MSLKRIIGFSAFCMAASGAAYAGPSHADYESARVVKTTVTCGEYKDLTGLDLCDIQSNVMMAESRYEELLQTRLTGTCLEDIERKYGTLQCQSLGDAFQAWQGRDVAMCERDVAQCNLVDVEERRTRTTIERTPIPAHRARFLRLGSAKAVTAK